LNNDDISKHSYTQTHEVITVNQ